MAEVLIRRARLADEAVFLAAVRRSSKLHRPWVYAPATSQAFRKTLASKNGTTHAAFFLWLRHPRELVGVVNVNEIVRGSFQSAYLGYYAFEPHVGKGLMREGLALVIEHAFGKMRLHRLEANIQPGNSSSQGLVQSLGFRLEGLSPRYLKVGGRWRDHERWALLAEEWRRRKA
jgi:[ribosomal protein S5]-alanine N-acetyltransferase